MAMKLSRASADDTVRACTSPPRHALSSGVGSSCGRADEHDDVEGGSTGERCRRWQRPDLDCRKNDGACTVALEQICELFGERERPRHYHAAPGEAHLSACRIASAPWSRSACAAAAPTASASAPSLCART